ncbi:MAG: entry exclusion lipoprotein TrbK [Rhodocyclaceae bacterium]|nr:entry exclusion lipoprotein TrbK [Rhodocyclaceae bacterium]
MRRAFIVLTAFAAAFTAGCGEPELPAVNDENCTIEAIKNIKSKAVQQEFAGLCLRRSVYPATPSANPMQWGLDGVKEGPKK